VLIWSPQEALRRDPFFPEAYNDLGNSLRQDGRFVQAVACYLACLQLHADAAQREGDTPHLVYLVAVTYNNLAAVLKLQVLFLNVH
jgi:protein O-GlcNAc transferase